MADEEMNTGAAYEAVVEKSLIGRKVRISPEAKDTGTDNLHFLAGMYGEISRPSPFSGWMVTVGKKTKHFDLADLELLPESGGDAAAETPPAAALTSSETRLVIEPPLLAINSPTNPRRRRGLDVDSLRTLADNIITHGLAQPILVRPLPSSRLEETAHLDPRPAYEVIAGERRWRAAQLAELTSMPFFVREMSDQAVLEIQLVENIEREDLDAMEEAEGFALLREKLGYTIEQIAERIGKGKGPSYVRKTMKLLDLTPESREAMYEGHLGRSTGLLVARYPAERQAAVVAFIKSQAVKTPAGVEPTPFRTLAPALHTRFNTALRTAAFDTEDATLILEAGACSACPKRTGQALDLFGDDEKVDVSCTDDACFAGKKAAHVQRIHVQAKAEGVRVIDGSEAAEIKPSPHSYYLKGYTDIESIVDVVEVEGEEDRTITIADALRGMGRKAPKPIILIDPHTSKVIKVVPDELAEKLKPKHEPGDDERSGQIMPRVDTATPEKKAWRDSMVRRAALFRAFDIIRSANERNCAELRRTALALLGGCMDDILPRLEDYLGWSDDLRESDNAFGLIKEKIMAMGAEELGQLVAMASLEQILTTYPHDENAPEVLAEYGIDILAVRDKVAEDLARQAETDATDSEVTGGEESE
jgi:ParB/RepB/Spo0J family partition protein